MCLNLYLHNGKNRGLILLLILLLSTRVYAQSGNANGKLVDKQTHMPVQNANITVYHDKSTVYYTVSDSMGGFKIPQKFLYETGYINISSLNYTGLRIDIKPKTYNFNDKDINLGTFQLSTRVIELKEVKIKQSTRYRDTTKIDLSQTKFERSYMVDDLFLNAYGFTKDEKGQLYYKGKLITDLVVNGGAFFGKSNMDIYRLLPALVLDNIEITETNIDSVTNTTLRVPQLKVNLKLKPQYNKAGLGNLNLGAGTAQRYLANTGLYSYKNNEQFSLSLNSNNLDIADNTIVEPKVGFSSTGNNSTLNTAGFTYRNLYGNNIEVNFSIKAKEEDRKFTSETDRQDEEPVNIFSKTFNSANAKTFNIQDGNFNVHYKIDPLNTLDITQTFDHLHTSQTDSLNYLIRADSANSSSTLNKINTANSTLYRTEINYQKKFSSKKGRLLSIDVRINNNSYNINELDNISSLNNQVVGKYFIDGTRQANENKYLFNSSYTEPVGDSCFFSLFANYERNGLRYNPQMSSDTTLSNTDEPATIINNYLKPGATFQKLFKKLTLNASIAGFIDMRDIEQSGNKNSTFLNMDVNINADFRLNKGKSLTLYYTSVTAYPDIQQLTSLYSSFDLITQTTSNIYLNPEEKKSLKLDYILKPSDSENIILGGQVDHYSSTFGYQVSDDVTALQAVKTANVGNSNGAQLSFAFLKSLGTNKYFNYTNSVTYQEAPTIINNKLILNNGIIVNQSLSTSFNVIPNLISVSPIVASSYSSYFYQASTIHILALTYYDKLSLQLSDYQLDIYPLFNYNHSISSTHSFSMNGELRKSFFKNYVSMWLQAYDIFNSFKFYNNNIGASYYQTIKYSDVERYCILGLSYKFNNIK